MYLYTDVKYKNPYSLPDDEYGGLRLFSEHAVNVKITGYLNFLKRGVDTTTRYILCGTDYSEGTDSPDVAPGYYMCRSRYEGNDTRISPLDISNYSFNLEQVPTDERYSYASFVVLKDEYSGIYLKRVHVHKNEPVTWDDSSVKIFFGGGPYRRYSKGIYINLK